MWAVLSENVTSVLVCAASILALWLTFRRPSGVPPGPGLPLPILGHTFSVGKDPRKKFREWRKKYGDIFSLYLGNKLVIVMNGYDVMVDAFVKNGDVFSDRPHVFVFDELNKGMGLFSTSGSVWKEQRRFTLSTLRDFGMGKRLLEHAISEECKGFLQSIKDRRGEKFDIRQLLHASVANLICTIVLGKKFAHDDDFFLELIRRIDEGGRLVGFTAALNFIPLTRYIPGDPFKFEETLRNKDFFQNRLARPSIEDHLKNFKENEITDLVSAYIREIKRTEKEGQETSFGFGNLENVIGDLVFAGSETTTTTIRWVLLLLMKYPEVQEKCFQEIKCIIGSERAPQMCDKLNLPYTEATITEGQRLANILPLSVWHSVPHDLTFRGYHFPKGVIVLPNIDSVLHDPAIFDDPEEFRPERFLDSCGKFLKRAEMIPFFIGKRVCAGESLARMELFLFMTGLIQQFKFQQPEGEPPLTMDPLPGITFSPKPFKLTANPR